MKVENYNTTGKKIEELAERLKNIKKGLKEIDEKFEKDSKNK
ncbi:hypothetical protein [Chondrinema litorale]|nr:hypothetical protein [Chondrinema litorale]UZR96903.1 hypothetical protein OQ292_24710 [Chondrinema litorale]